MLSLSFTSINAMVITSNKVSVYKTSNSTSKIVEPIPEILKMTPTELFALFDLDGNGQISYAEVAQVLERNPTIYSQIPKKLDLNPIGGDQTVASSLDEDLKKEEREKIQKKSLKKLEALAQAGYKSAIL
jgi:hypothetical protein